MFNPIRLQRRRRISRVGACDVLGVGRTTATTPMVDIKPLVPVAGTPLLDHVLDKLADAGVSDAVVSVHYLHRAHGHPALNGADRQQHRLFRQPRTNSCLLHV
jgi:CTP:molybdopterin cytidylyltransferase MocA